MSMQSETGRVLLDPTGEQSLVQRERAPRLEKLEGAIIGLLDISKARGDIFLDRLEGELTNRGAIIKRYRKPTFTKPAPHDLRQQIASECAAVVEALAD
ncbi:MAG: hypothetical protein ACI8W3_001149 [Myxococcota bacterium]|jgi:hypothetical protein